MTDDRPRRDLLTTVEAADLLRMSPRTLEAMRVDGTGPRFFKLGPGRMAKVVYRPEDLDAWVDQFGFQSTSEYAVAGDTKRTDQGT